MRLLLTHPGQSLIKETARLEREFPMQPIQASQFESLFESKLHLYDLDRDMILQEQHDQDQIAAQVREANRAFTRAQRGDASSKEREKALQELENGYLKYKEILSNIEVGRKFYNDLAKHVGRFRDDCKAFVQQRRMEASQIEAYIFTFSRVFGFGDANLNREISSVAAMASLNLSSQSHFRQQPASHPKAYSQSPAPAPAPASAPAQLPTPAQSIQSPKPQPQPQPQTQPQTRPQVQQPPTPTHQPRPSATGEPLQAPQPTRAPVAPPSIPTPGIWSPEMGIRFGGPSPATGRGQSQPGPWNPGQGIRFS